MIPELAVADAVGSGREYAPAEEVEANNDGESYVQHQKWTELVPGRYTDDTQMTIAVSEHLLSGKPHTAINIVDSFLNCFHRDPRPGYASGFYKLLQETRTPEEFLRKLTPQSNRSGGAMRASSCGLLHDLAEVVDMAAWQASITHATRDGMAAASAAAALVWACRHGSVWEELPAFLEDTLPGFQWHQNGILWRGPVGPPGLESVKAALAAIVRCRGDLTSTVKQAIAFTGDVDTVAAIAISAASVHPQANHNLSPKLFAGLEPTGHYGLPFLQDLDRRLMERFPL